MRDYIFIDSGKLSSLYDQIDSRVHEPQESQSSFELSLTGPKYSYKKNYGPSSVTDHQKIDQLTNYLSHSGRLSGERPFRVSHRDFNGALPEFVLEQCTATKVVIPARYRMDIEGLRHLSIWISDPLHGFEESVGDEWDFCGTFLYLTEVHLDADLVLPIMSGCSALQFIYNQATGRDLLTTDPYERLGRGSSLHPIQKLESLGGIVGDARTIECLYRPRYMIDEQRFSKLGSQHRVNDMVAYPIYIAEII